MVIAISCGSQLQLYLYFCFCERTGMVLKIVFPVIVLIFAFVSYLLLNDCLLPEDDPKSLLPDDVWYGPGTEKKEDSSLKPFRVNVSDRVIRDVRSRVISDLDRLPRPIEGTAFNYGFNGNYLRQIGTYWKDSFDWRVFESKLNSFPQFTTEIDGINVHYIHAKPNAKAKRVVPLLLVHGWPGSVLEFLKIIPMLTEDPDLAFEVVAPSIPGYGFSSAPAQEGFDAVQAAKLFKKLMQRLGHERFYTQAGDWGSFITYCMGVLYPENVIGHHTNFAQALGLGASLKRLLAPRFPWLFSIPEEQRFMLKDPTVFFTETLKESGYLHIQATKPDTLGAALQTSPLGLAAWLLEKFSTGTKLAYRDLDDGGLTKKYSEDELLANVMLYWVTESATSAARFYLENMGRKDSRMWAVSAIPLKVPAGVAVFPNEIAVFPQSILSAQYRNIVLYEVMPRGGHFAALEEPKLLQDSLRRFVAAVEKGNVNK